MSTVRRTRESRAADRRRAGWWRDMVTALIGLWLVGAVFSDGWAHFNVPELESFFTPWHLALYAGFAVMAAWVGLLAWRGRRPGTVPLEWVPYGYRGAVLGLVIFGLGGVADLIWHEVFGVEVAVDALVSPSHLLLGAGALLILTSPLRAQRLLSPAASDHPPTWTLPAVVSLVLTTALVGFFLLYVSPFPTPAPVEVFVPTPEGTPGHLESELPVIAGLGSYLVATAVIVVPFLLMLRSQAGLPRGGLTLLVGTYAGLSVMVMDFPAVAVAGALGATLGAGVADFWLATLPARARESSAAPALLAGGFAVLVWSGQLAGLAITAGLGWPVSLWFGVVVLAGFGAAALGLLSSSTTRVARA
jgi:hypothetical protein